MKTLSLTVLQFNNFVKNILDAEDFLSNISVFGEVTNFKISGGNAYFDIKDENAMLSCVKFGAYDLNVKNGDLITVYGKVNFYVKSGRLNFIVAKAEAYGLGVLYQKFIELKEKLTKEGLFAEEIKKSIPRFAKTIGVVTSETGAVIRDIIHVARSKNPYTNIIVYPSKVQGIGAEDELVSGIEYFDQREDIDTIIIARGGGSIEDLAPFNTEKLVRAIYASNKPIISGVGHETDFTLCDFASDLRVPTPSVASEVAVFDYYEQVNLILELSKNITYFTGKVLDSSKENLVNTSKHIISNIKLKLGSSENETLMLSKEIENLVFSNINNKKSMFDKLTSLISAKSPLEILKNGYGVVENNNKRVSSIDDIAVGDELKINFVDGEILAKTINKNKFER